MTLKSCASARSAQSLDFKLSEKHGGSCGLLRNTLMSKNTKSGHPLTEIGTSVIFYFFIMSFYTLNCAHTRILLKTMGWEVYIMCFDKPITFRLISARVLKCNAQCIF